MRSVDACCDHAPESDRAAPRPRRSRLADLSVHMHCSVLGTCLTTAGLRSVVARHTDLDARRASDLDVHHAGVELAGQNGTGVKALQKALDDKHAAILKRYAQFNAPEQLLAQWTEALDSGDVPGAYWALLTHPSSTPELSRRAFGDVHMLSHLVGAANRADLRRLALLEQEHVELKTRFDRQQERMLRAAAERDAAHRELASLQIEVETLRAVSSEGAESELATARREVQERERSVALQATRREAAEREAMLAQEDAKNRSAELASARQMIGVLSAEVTALEREVAGDEAVATNALQAPSLKTVLAGRRVVYVGGRPSTSHAIRALVERSGGELVSHDGGVEQRKGQFASSLPGADVVLFPVDCVDHDSVGLLKRLCERHGVAYRPLRSASVASFVAAVAELGAPVSVASAPGAGSHFCMRHG